MFVKLIAPSVHLSSFAVLNNSDPCPVAGEKNTLLSVKCTKLHRNNETIDDAVIFSHENREE